MNRTNAVVISLALGVAAVAGTLAATKTVRLGHASVAPATTAPTIAKRSRALDRAEIALRKALKQRPPKLPPLPAAASPTPAGGYAAPAQAQAQRVVYVRPAPIIRHVHRAGGGEFEGGDHGDSGGGGFDD